MGVLGRNLCAQGYAQAVTLAVQLLSAPVLIGLWGAERFGTWLLLLALPALLAFGDLGFTFVTKNEMAMRRSRGATRRALALYQSVLALLLAAGLALLLLLLPLIWLLPPGAWGALGVAPALAGEARLALTALALAAVLWQFFLLQAAGLRAQGHAAQEAAIAATARLADGAGILAAALAGGGPAAAAAAMLALRLVLLVLFATHLRRRVPWLRHGLRDGLRLARRAELRRLAPAALGYMAVPLGHVLLSQGPVLVLGALAGPAAVTAFAVLRTVVRLGAAGANMLAHAFTPEYSRAFGAADGGRFRGLLRLHLALLAPGIAGFALILPVVLPWAYDLMVRGAVAFDPGLALALAAGVLAEMVWTTLFAPLAAVNRHRGLGALFGLLGGAALGGVVVAASAVGLPPAPPHALMPGSAPGLATALATGVAAAQGGMVLASGRALRQLLAGLTKVAGPAGAPRRIVFLGLASWSATGGLQRFNRRLIAALLREADAQGWQVRAMLRGDRTADIPPALRGRVRGWGRSGDWGSLGGGAVALVQALRADVVFLGHINLLPLGWLARRLGGGRLILFAHGVEVWGDPRWRRPRPLEVRMLRACDRIAAVSAFTAGRMGRAHGLAPERFVIFPNTVDAVAGAPGGGPGGDTGCGRGCGLGEGPRGGLLTVTRLGAHDAEKHVDAVLRALVHLPEEHLTVVGDGPLRPGLEALARTLGVAGRVRFAGRVDDGTLAALYRAAGIFVLPSAKEGFGIVYLEAWAHGLPVICGTEGAGPEVVRDGIDGFAVPPGDPVLLARRIAALRGDRALAARMAAAGRARIAECYSPANLDRNLRALLGPA